MFTPLNDYVILEVFKNEKPTTQGLLIVDKSEEECILTKVINVDLINPEIKKGDVVLVEKDKVLKFVLNGHDVMITHTKNILALLKE